MQIQTLLSQERADANDPIRARYTRELDPDDVLIWLNLTARTTQVFREIYSEANSTERSTIVMPEELPNAWLHLLMALVCSSKEQHWSLFQDKSSSCSRLLKDGMQKVVENLGQKSLLEFAVFKPWEVASLVNIVLLGDITGQSRDISDTYVEYLNYLVSPTEVF